MDPVLLTPLRDLVLQDAEDEHVQALAVLESSLPEHALLPKAVAPQRVGAHTVVFVDLALDAQGSHHIDSIVRDELSRLHSRSPTDRPPTVQRDLAERAAL